MADPSGGRKQDGGPTMTSLKITIISWARRRHLEFTNHDFDRFKFIISAENNTMVKPTNMRILNSTSLYILSLCFTLRTGPNSPTWLCQNWTSRSSTFHDENERKNDKEIENETDTFTHVYTHYHTSIAGNWALEKTEKKRSYLE